MKWPDCRLPYEKVFRDPIHNYIRIQDKIILDLINTCEFQRLRRVKQLGTASLVFHGAEHSRFGHSLGVYEITRQICEQFANDYPQTKYGEDGWDENERIVALCAALLHDIGHGAYSHTFEHLFKTHHEQIGIQIILDDSTEIHHVLKNFHPDFPQAVADVIAKKYHNPQVIQMISSQADADRMDYLLRDAYYTGANYGIFDLTRILRVMRPYKNGICFKDVGMHAVEDYITSRYQMFLQVYFHPVSRGMEVVLAKMIERAKDLFHKAPTSFEQTSPRLIPFFNHQFTLQDYLALDDGVLNTYFQEWMHSHDTILADLSRRFVNRKPFKSIHITEGTDLRHLRVLKTQLEKIGYPARYYADVTAASDLPYDIYHARKHHPRTQIELRREDGTLLELSTQSNMVQALSGEVQRDNRFFFPREIIKETADYPIADKQRKEFASYIHNHTFIPKPKGDKHL